MIVTVLDEVGLQPTLGASGIPEAFYGLREFLEELRIRKITRLKHSNVWHAVIAPDVMLFDVLFNKGTLDEELRQRLYREIDRLPHWNSSQKNYGTRQFVAEQLSLRCPSACIVLREHSGGVEVDGTNVPLIGASADLLNFYRLAPEICDLSEAAFVALAASAFPNLHFKDGIENEIRRFSLAYRSIRSLLISALSDLNDLLFPLLGQGLDGREIVRRFNAGSDFKISSESPKTHKNAAAMRQRTVDFGGRQARCEWHLKIRPDRDRIHFSLGDSAIAPNKILVGIFTAHLPT